MAVYNLRNVGFKIRTKWLLQEINLELPSGKFIALVGSNGAGKTTLLKLLSGELQTSQGYIEFMDKPIVDYSLKSLAHHRAVLSQHRGGNFPFSVQEVVMMGRLVHLDGCKEGPKDNEIVQKALERMDLSSFANRTYSTLSGGEARRVDAARMIVQQTGVYLLDEPTNHLDPKQQVRMLEFCKESVAEGKTVIASLHDLNLASYYADMIVILHQGHLLIAGSPDQVFTSTHIKEAFGLDCNIWRHPSGCPWMVPALGGEDVSDEGMEYDMPVTPELFNHHKRKKTHVIEGESL